MNTIRRTYPLLVHSCLRTALRIAGAFPGVWRLKQRLLDMQRTGFPEGWVRTTLSFGQQLWVNPNDLIGRWIFYSGLWEGPIARHFYHSLRPGDSVLDVGANIGQYTILAGTKVGTTGQVFAVEPSSLAQSYLARNIRLNQLTNVQILQIAAWDTDKMLHLTTGDPDNCGSAEICINLGHNGTACVPGKRLDRVLVEFGCQHLDIVKLDIEGAELPALRGLSGLFGNDPPRSVYCEVSGRTTRFGHNSEDLFTFFDQYGYSVWEFADKGLIPFSKKAITPAFFGTLLFSLDAKQPAVTGNV